MSELPKWGKSTGGANAQNALHLQVLRLHVCNPFNNIMTWNERRTIFPAGALQHLDAVRSKLFGLSNIGAWFMQ